MNYKLEIDLGEAQEEIQALREKVAEMRGLLKDIAAEKLFEEMTEEEQDDSCFSDGYDDFIRTAREYLEREKS